MINIDLNTSHQLLLSLSMQKSLLILQLPVMELKSWLEEELLNNPAIEVIDDTTSQEEEGYVSKSYSSAACSREAGYNLVEKIECQQSLYQHLIDQAPMLFSSKEELWIATQLIGNLDDKGFITAIPESLIDIVPIHLVETILKKLQQMDPPGICARTCRESLLIQLTIQQKEGSLLYHIIKNYYSEFIEQKITLLEKKLKIPHGSLIESVKSDLHLLDPFPGLRFKKIYNAPITPDVAVEKIDNQWKISINTKPLPKYTFSSDYITKFDLLSSKDQKYLMRQYSGARWIIRSIKRRNETLLQVTRLLLKKQNLFFETDSNEILPLTIQEVAEELQVSDSTVTRAVADKHLACSKGMMPLKSFFSLSASKTSDSKSIQCAKKTLRKLIHDENKKKPLSDEELVLQMKRQGFHCARRTITKYRQSLDIAPSRIRKIQ